MKSFFTLRENQQITEAITVSRADFEKLKKGDKITITYDSSIRKGTTTTFTVKGKSRSAKYNVDKISMSADGKMGKYFLYSRDGKDATLALGDMAATIQKYVKESVELDEASREDKIKQTIKIMKKYPANKGKSEKELRKGAIAYLDQKKESVDEAKTGLPTGQSTVDYENSIQKLMKTLKKDPKNKGKSGNELRKLATFKLTGHTLKESIDEAKVRGADAYDKTFANRKQADKFAREMGGRVKQVGRVFHVFKEEVEEASIIKTVHKNVTNKKSAEKDRKKAVKTFKDIRKGKYPGVKIAKESVELDEATTVSRADFDKLKKGSMITIDYGSSIRGSTTRTFQVKSKTRSAKYNVDKVNMVDPKKPGGMKFHLYSRDGKDATLSLGDMGATINSYSIKESIEEYKKENPMVMNLKGKKVELLKTGSSFKPTFTLTVDGKEKGKFGSEKDAMKHFARMTKESVELDEATMSPSQVAQLKKAYGGIEKINPTGPAYKKAKAFIANMSKDELMTIAKAKIRWLSQFAASELARSHNVKLKAKDYMGEATYQGKKVPLNKPMAGDVKKSKVYVDPDGDGVAKKVNFGDKNMKIKKNIPARRKSFRARHNCDNPGPKDKARYWSCKAW